MPIFHALGFRAQIKLADRIWDAFPSVPRLPSAADLDAVT
jgi:hypothetical protein